MSTGKRVAKRSILGTKVMVPGVDGLYRPGFIQAMKTCEPDSSDAAAMRYSVRLEDSGRVFEFAARDVVGGGGNGGGGAFRSVSEVQLPPGQRVFVTHNTREVTARVVRHDFATQDVLLTIDNGGGGGGGGGGNSEVHYNYCYTFILFRGQNGHQQRKTLSALRNFPFA